MKRGNVIDNSTRPGFFDAYKRTYIAESKIASFYTKDMYLPVVRRKMNKTNPPMLLKKRFMLEARALLFPRNHFLYESFDQKLQQYIEADLINYNVRYFSEGFYDPKKMEQNEEPFAVLTLEQLEAGFVVCITPLVLSVFVFAFEWIPTLKDLIVFLYIFKKYFTVKKIEQRNHSKLMKPKFAEWQAAYWRKESRVQLQIDL